MSEMERSLVVAPKTHTTESSASWLLRICRMHSVTYPALMEAFGLPCYIDPDVSLDGPTLSLIGAGTSVARGETLRLGSIFRSIRSCPSLSVLLHRDERGMPAYKFCDLCLSSDKYPYLRLEWRIAGLKSCLIHNVRLKTRCWSCAATLQATRTPMKSFGEGLTLANCKVCQAYLPVGQGPDDEEDEPQLGSSSQKSLVAAVLHGYFYVSGCDLKLPLGFLTWLLETDQYRSIAQPQETCGLEPPLVAAAVRGLYSAYKDRPLRRKWFAETLEFC